MRIPITKLREGYGTECEDCVFKSEHGFDIFCFGCSYYGRKVMKIKGTRAEARQQYINNKTVPSEAIKK